MPVLSRRRTRSKTLLDLLKEEEINEEKFLLLKLKGMYPRAKGFCTDPNCRTPIYSEDAECPNCK
ncbi:MAG: hypothetical protein WC849_00770 [Candidatus Paceibacterota bacterium]